MNLIEFNNFFIKFFNLGPIFIFAIFLFISPIYLLKKTADNVSSIFNMILRQEVAGNTGL
jgi:hypothetical protein